MIKDYERSFFESILADKNKGECYLFFHNGDSCGACVYVAEQVKARKLIELGKVVEVPRLSDIWIGLSARFRPNNYPCIVKVINSQLIAIYYGASIIELFDLWKQKEEEKAEGKETSPLPTDTV